MHGKRNTALIAVALACAMPLVACQSLRNDFTTTPWDPPQFEALAALPENEGRDLGYPYPRDEPPAIPPLPVPGPDPDPAGTLAKVEAAAGAMAAWEIIAVNPERLRLEAVATTRLLEFKDDVVIEIRQVVDAETTVADPEGGEVTEGGPDPAAAAPLEVHMRSKSRVGRYDFGANRARVARFFDTLESAFAE